MNREAAAYWVPRLRGGRRGWEPLAALGNRLVPHTFFFTSLTLEKVMPSARSRV
jgi:hypothetical protein